LILLPILVLVAAGCRARAERDSHGEHDDDRAADVTSVSSCSPGQDPNVSVKTRKDRIAKGVYRASRRIRVDGELELWDTPYGPYWVVADNFDTFSDVLAEQAVEIYGDKARGVRQGDVVLD